MATVVLPPALATRVESVGSMLIDGATAGEVLRALEKRQPSWRGHGDRQSKDRSSSVADRHSLETP